MFVDEEHKMRFFRWHNGTASREHIALIYLFTARRELEKKIGPYYSPDTGEFYFEEMLENEDFSGGMEVLARLGVVVFNRGIGVDISELSRLDEDNFRLAMKTIEMRYRGFSHSFHKFSPEDFEICDASEATHVRITETDPEKLEDVTHGKIYERYYDPDPSEETYYIVADVPNVMLYDFDVYLKCEYLRKKERW